MSDPGREDRFDSVEWSWRNKRQVGEEIGMEKLGEDESALAAKLFGGRVVAPSSGVRRKPRKIAPAEQDRTASS